MQIKIPISKTDSYFNMNFKDKKKYKSDFKKELDTFADKLKRYVSTENGDWTVKGFIDVYKNIYTI